MSNEKKTIGAAIDEIIAALSGMDAKAQIIAISAACQQLDISNEIVTPTNSQGAASPQIGSNYPAVGTHKIVSDIRSFAESKAPSSAKEMACIVAYYLDNMAAADETKSTIGAADIEKYFKQANYPLPQAVKQLLPDAKNAGYFDSADRGTYKLNAVGHNLVAHTLPRASGVQKSSLTASSRAKPKRKAAKAAKSKSSASKR
ncbi:MAG: hypothetical protein JNM13_04100 [Hyphomicrobiaceae bacterium]|nr:hypothetical protein [Hyphomicrobiaceae bacterium]